MCSVFLKSYGLGKFSRVNSRRLSHFHHSETLELPPLTGSTYVLLFSTCLVSDSLVVQTWLSLTSSFPFHQTEAVDLSSKKFMHLFFLTDFQSVLSFFPLSSHFMNKSSKVPIISSPLLATYFHIYLNNTLNFLPLPP